MNEKHSPDSFYEKLVEYISGTCRVCQKSFSSSEMDHHVKREHSSYKNYIDKEVNNVIEDVLQNVIDLSDSESEDISEGEEEEINIDFEYSVEKESSIESFKGKKPLFVQCVKALKTLFYEKGDANAKIINQHKMVVKDARNISYGMEADVEISIGRMKGLASVKIWGPSKSPNSKNKCSIMISKYSKNSDPKFATTLSRKIIRPLLESYLKGKGWKDTIKSLMASIKTE